MNASWWYRRRVLWSLPDVPGLRRWAVGYELRVYRRVTLAWPIVGAA